MDRTMLVAFAFILASYGCVANDDLTTTFDERREESTSTDGIGQAPTTTTFDERREEVTSTDGTDQATCADTSEEATGTNGGGCEWWTDYAQYCAYDYLYDDSDFTAGDMCCACGGGEVGDSTAPTPTSPTPAPTSSPNPATCADTSEGATGTNGGGCEWWTDYAQYCAYDYLYDDSDFTAGDMCCACGGGEGGDSTAPTPTSPTPAPTPSPNPATCADTSEEAIGTNGGGCATCADTSEEAIGTNGGGCPDARTHAISESGNLCGHFGGSNRDQWRRLRMVDRLCSVLRI
ncbi:unnamed protein product [Prorocentrum cordatum]|uniref:Cellulase n=1 Tax=Prorocentrum cordatum TaxID=2364126 RepID=A0ABN9TWX0_9DINO|nr:unnamed protein product [Polarella glacialis]